MTAPVLKKCCFCFPLRAGILFFGFVNILFSLLAVASLVLTVELKKHFSIINDSSLEAITATVLFSIFGMGVILNILLLIAGYQKDISMLRLYNYYAIAMTVAALIPTFVLLAKVLLVEAFAAFLAICIQYYVILLVDSEIEKLEELLLRVDDGAEVNIPDDVTLL